MDLHLPWCQARDFQLEALFWPPYALDVFPNHPETRIPGRIREEPLSGKSQTSLGPHFALSRKWRKCVSLSLRGFLLQKNFCLF